MNVKCVASLIIWTGPGSTIESVRHCLYSLRRLLSPNYTVGTISGETIIKEPWGSSCALLVFPGGADLGYCRTLEGKGNRRIRQYVNLGGSYLGLCAGGYYGSKRCEFEVGNEDMEIAGDRELEFFPGVCRGSAFPGFVYKSEVGTHAAKLKSRQDLLLVWEVCCRMFSDRTPMAAVFLLMHRCTDIEEWKY